MIDDVGNLAEQLGGLPGRNSFGGLGSAGVQFGRLNETLVGRSHAQFIVQTLVDFGGDLTYSPTTIVKTVYDIGFLPPYRSPLPSGTYFAFTKFKKWRIFLIPMCSS